MPKPGNTFKLYYLLAPFSLIYGIIVGVRNLLFNCGILPSEEYKIPVISVGNLSLGGTGKTPHTEYLIGLLSQKYKVAVLSRGYKRETKNFLLAGDSDTALTIGDEPYQMKRKFPDALVAVDNRRRRGICNLLALPDTQRPEVILLDDAFQHRYVTPSLSILITDYNRLFYKDGMLPFGHLREPKSNMKRANIIVVSKCAGNIHPIDFRIIENEMGLQPYQHLYFTRIVYGKALPVFPVHTDNAAEGPLLNVENEVLLLAGIASPRLFIAEAQERFKKVTTMLFRDHHVFDRQDIRRIKETFNRMDSPDKFILVTEKDAVRLLHNPFIPDEWKKVIYYLPIHINFCKETNLSFDDCIKNHITTFRRNNIFHMKQ
ncbi:MAG: tetraacyldisaccharide 4'-kinase [Tannerellaceae bacterium]|jgi:tetraacyldisaccharide 4'-kinase|nr:tetraacyldisaccharide 4'-kinase [Tannerellaceae bacterium]